MWGNKSNAQDAALARVLSEVEQARSTAWLAYNDARRAHERLERYCEQRRGNTAERAKESGDEC